MKRHSPILPFLFSSCYSCLNVSIYFISSISIEIYHSLLLHLLLLLLYYLLIHIIVIFFFYYSVFIHAFMISTITPPSSPSLPPLPRIILILLHSQSQSLPTILLHILILFLHFLFLILYLFLPSLFILYSYPLTLCLTTFSLLIYNIQYSSYDFLTFLATNSLLLTANAFGNSSPKNNVKAVRTAVINPREADGKYSVAVATKSAVLNNGL